MMDLPERATIEMTWDEFARYVEPILRQIVAEEFALVRQRVAIIEARK